MKKISSQKLQLKRVSMAQIGVAAGGISVGCPEFSAVGERCVATTKASEEAPTMKAGPNACGGYTCGCPGGGDVYALAPVALDDGGNDR